MKKRVLAIFLLILFLGGCKVKYNLKVENGKLKEHMEVISEESGENSLYDFYKENQNSKLKYKKFNNKEELLYEDESDIKDIKKLYAYNCFEEKHVKVNKETIQVFLRPPFVCDHVGKALFSLKGEILMSNADVKNKDEHIWNNPQEGVSFLIRKKNKTKKINLYFIIAFINFIILAFLIYYVLNRGKK